MASTQVATRTSSATPDLIHMSDNAKHACRWVGQTGQRPDRPRPPQQRSGRDNQKLLTHHRHRDSGKERRYGILRLRPGRCAGRPLPRRWRRRIPAPTTRVRLRPRRRRQLADQAAAEPSSVDSGYVCTTPVPGFTHAPQRSRPHSQMAIRPATARAARDSNPEPRIGSGTAVISGR
jgi:hypothetical protein